jgi:hypothetical protein
VLFTLASTTSDNAARGIPPELQSAVAAARGRGVDVSALLNTALVWEGARIVVQPLKTSEPKTLIEGARDARYSTTGHFVYVTGETLMAVRFNADRHEVLGTPVKFMDRLRTAGTSTGTAQFSFSNTGTLVYLSTDTSQPAQRRQFGFADMSGKVTMLRNTSGTVFRPRISPDGKRAAYRDLGAVWPRTPRRAGSCRRDGPPDIAAYRTHAGRDRPAKSSDPCGAPADSSASATTPSASSRFASSISISA